MASEQIGTAVLMENDDVKIWDFALAPGEAFPMHTHRRTHVIVVIQGGTLETGDEQGRSRTVHPRAGDHYYCAVTGEETHDARNVGTTAYRNLVIELKR